MKTLAKHGLVLLASLFLGTSYAQIGGGINIDRLGQTNDSGTISTRGSQEIIDTGCDCDDTFGLPCGGTRISIHVEPSYFGRQPHEPATFDLHFHDGNGGPVACGKLATGDYWLALTEGHSDIVVTSIGGNGTIRADVDINPENTGILEGYDNWNPNKNLVPNLPVSFNPTNDPQSLVIVKQRDEEATVACGTRAIEGSCVDAMATITLYPNLPNNLGKDLIRPNITGNTKSELGWYDFDLDSFPYVNHPSIPEASDEDIETIRQRWAHNSGVIGWANSEGGRAFRSHILVHDYAAGMMTSYSNDLYTLMGVQDREKIKPALAAMIAYGIDNYHYIFDNMNGEAFDAYWRAGATQASGRFPPVAVAVSLMRGENQYKANTRTISDKVHDPVYVEGSSPLARGPLELGQIYVGHNGPIWGGTNPPITTSTINSYWNSLLGSQCFDGALGEPECDTGARNEFDPYRYIDGPAKHPGRFYFSSSLANMRQLVMMMGLMPQMCEIVNYPPIIEFTTRVLTEGVLTQPDPCAPPDPRENPDTCDPRYPHTCEYYGVTWGPSDVNDPQSSCVVNNTGPFTDQNGRFPHLHGEEVSISGYTGAIVNAMWDDVVSNGVCGQ